MKINEICEYAPKSSVKAGDACEDGKYMFFTSSADENKRYTDFQFDGEGIIMGTGGNATLHYYNGKYAISTDCVVLLPNKSIRCKYLYYFLNKNMAVLEAGFKGAGLRHTNKNYIGDIEIGDIPALEFQDTIINELDFIQRIIEVRKQQLSSLDALVKARFVEMFGDPVSNPLSWPTHKLSKYIHFLTSGSRGWAKYFSEGGEYFITIRNVKNCRIALDYIQHITPPKNAEAKRTKVQEGDLLISITADLGRTGIVSKEIAEHGGYINQHLTLIRLVKEILNPFYVAFYMESDAGKMQFLSKNQSAVKAGLNFNAINSLRLMVPPLAQQNVFVEFITQVDKLRVVVQKTLAEAQTLFDSLMQKYFG